MHSGKLTFRLVSTFEFITSTPPQSLHIYLFVTAVVSHTLNAHTRTYAHIHIPNHIYILVRVSSMNTLHFWFFFRLLVLFGVMMCLCASWQLIELNNNVDVDGGDTRRKEGKKNIPTISPREWNLACACVVCTYSIVYVSGENYER